MKTHKVGKMTILKIMFLSLTTILISSSVLAEENLTVVDHIEATTKDGFDNTGLWILGSGALATIVAFQFDQQTHDAWKDHQKMSADFSKYGNFWGTGIPEVIAIGGQIYFDKTNGIPAAEGFLIGGVVTHATKFLIRRERPDSNTKTALPSGHTQAAFSLAASMTESYGWKVGAPFWGLGIFTGLTRLADNAHWLSDVVAGATVGVLFGRAGYKHHRQIQPTVLFNDHSVDGAALALTMEW